MPDFQAAGEGGAWQKCWRWRQVARQGLHSLDEGVGCPLEADSRRERLCCGPCPESVARVGRGTMAHIISLFQCRAV